MMNILAILAFADTDAVITVVASVTAIPNIRYSKSSKSVSAKRATVVDAAGSSAVNVSVVDTAV